MISNHNGQPQKNQISLNISSNFYSAIFDHQETLSRADILIYHAIGDLGDLTHCDAYQDEIADRANISVRQCQRSIAKLVEADLITVDKSRRQHHIYYYVYPKPGAFDDTSQVGTTHESSEKDSKTTLNTTTKDSDKLSKSSKSITPSQLTLIENDDAQNLGALDIQPHLVQNFPTAPKKCKTMTPAQILAFDPDAPAISANLARWRQAHDDGTANLAGLTPALIWVKIVELQSPPLITPESPDPELVQAVEMAEIAQESHQEAIIEPEEPVFPETIADEAQGLPDDPARFLTPEPLSDPPPIDSDPVADLWAETLEDLRLSTTKGTFEARLAQTELQAMDDRFVIIVPDSFSQVWLDKRLRHLVVDKLSKRLGEMAVEVEFVVAEQVIT